MTSLKANYCAFMICSICGVSRFPWLLSGISSTTLKRLGTAMGSSHFLSSLRNSNQNLPLPTLLSICFPSSESTITEARIKRFGSSNGITAHSLIHDSCYRRFSTSTREIRFSSILMIRSVRPLRMNWLLETISHSSAVWYQLSRSI